MFQRRAPWLMLLAVLAAQPCIGQDAPPASAPESDSPIVVTGKAAAPASRAQAYGQALDLSRTDPHKLYDRPLARFTAPVCPGAFGLRADYAQAIAARIRENAARLKVKLAKPGCTPNLLVAMLDDGRSFLTGLEREHPQMFRLVSDNERRELMEEPSSVRVFTNLRTIGPYGPVPVRNNQEQMPSVSNMAMYLPMHKDILWSLVVFDREAVLGMTLAQLADYATMRGLSHTRPASGDEELPTILALFAGDGGSPDALTSFDVGYLGSLYFDRPNSRAVSKLLGVRKRAAAEAARP